ncbi:formylmethanofuran dehydrogenase subunit E [Dethiosulfatibacter aminovorans DSM 17477]|uniref:Formylmethanofuran dehydrogenase subunit E n=1 Tax=Dethiosulfatibacter aminovorans DSM 17477 TaxID=1121476 RepID=A0A1M6C3P0_9FIRM|nr:FmdE family protein [Dethiosulfatibacter aminovorans]SHI55640.1 formylmethanofuran dehydrogenase subunit E [Dethiosulfatibacter aminovorans DSM 17477]
MDKKLWEECIKFHGHECPGLAIGYRAVEIAKEHLGDIFSPSHDEEIVCVTENDACGVDAVQWMTGCTVGKGNLIYRPTGKMAFSFFLRESGRSIRIVRKPKPGDAPMSREESKRYILEAPADEVFWVKEPEFELPERARIFDSVVCEKCGEASPEHKIRIMEGKKVCSECFTDYQRGW